MFLCLQSYNKNRTISLYLKQTMNIQIFLISSGVSTCVKSCVIWTFIYMTTFETIKILQRKWSIDTKIKAIKRESKNIIWIWERKLLQKLSKNGCSNIISYVWICVRGSWTWQWEQHTVFVRLVGFMIFFVFYIFTFLHFKEKMVLGDFRGWYDLCLSAYKYIS